MPAKKTPKVFISYSHDSEGHRHNVLLLCNKLRADGIDTWIDQFETFPAEGWPRWMARQLEEADFVLIVCSKKYLQKITETESLEAGKGVLWESHLIYQYIYEASTCNRKFIPVLLGQGSTEDIPPVLRSFTQFRPDKPKDYDRLHRLLSDNTPEVPPLGALRKPAPLQSGEVQNDYPNLAISKWLTTLEQLVDSGHIVPKEKSALLRHILKNNYREEDSLTSTVRKIAGLSEWGKLTLLELNGETMAEKLISIEHAGRHQLLAAISLESELVVTALGIPFIFIPPGRSRDGASNSVSFYMAETPVSEDQWQRIMGTDDLPATKRNVAKTNLSLRQVYQFIDTANQQLKGPLRLRIPTVEQWNFAASPGDTSIKQEISSPKLRHSRPNNFRLHDLCWLVYQFCSKGSGFVLTGGSYQTCRNYSSSKPPQIACPSNVFQSPEYGFRPILILREEPNYASEYP